MKYLISGILGGSVGLASVAIGYGIDTWQYWVFAIPQKHYIAKRWMIMLEN
jgi:hypothetical protein